MLRAGRPRAMSASTVRCATSPDPGCRPWSTVTARNCASPREWRNAAAAASASESAPPDTATTNGSPPGTSAARSAVRTAAVAESRRGRRSDGAGSLTVASRCVRDRSHPVEPELRIGDLAGLGQGLGSGEHAGEALVAHRVDDGADEGRALAVLPQLRIHAQQAAHRTAGSHARVAAGLEARADRGKAGDDGGADRVHDDVRVALEEAHDRDDPVEEPARGRAREGIEDLDLAAQDLRQAA